MTKNTYIQAYSLSDPASAKLIITNALEHLRQPAYFKTALALYRRLQFGRFLDSSYLYTNLQLDSPNGSITTSDKEPWFYAFIDRGCRPETEVWIFGSWEVETQQHINPASNGTTNERSSNDSTTTKDDQVRTLLLALIQTLKSETPPPSIHPDSAVLTAQSQIATKDAHLKPTRSAADITNPTTMLWGAVHATTTTHLQALGLAATNLLPVMPNHTFVFPISALPAPAPTSLPPTLRWGKLQKQHFPLVRSRTEIARQDFTLTRLPNLAVFPVEPADAAPVAWAFVGLDGSLTTLHTEASHRRLGLAMALTAKLFREEMGFFWEEGVERLAIGNVAVGNEASASMCRRLGGEDIGLVFWVRVDLDAKSQAASNGV